MFWTAFKKRVKKIVKSEAIEKEENDLSLRLKPWWVVFSEEVVLTGIAELDLSHEDAVKHAKDAKAGEKNSA